MILSQKDGRYLVLVVGPFANLSGDFMVLLCDFLGRARAVKAINSWDISPKHALAMNRHIVSFWSLGFFGLGKADSGSFS